MLASAKRTLKYKRDKKAPSQLSTHKERETDFKGCMCVTVEANKSEIHRAGQQAGQQNRLMKQT